MDRLITNVQAGPPKGAVHRGGLFTRILVETTVEARPSVSTMVSDRGVVIRMEFESLELNMPESSIEVHDGLIDHVELRSSGPGSIVEAHLEHDVPFVTNTSTGVPCRFEVLFDMAPAYRVLAGRTLVIDPGHGGRDTGGTGPVNLLEKDVVLDLGKRLRSFGERAGARCVMTRNGDFSLSTEARLDVVAKVGASAFMSLHTGVAADPGVRGAGAAWAGSGGEELAGLVLAELTRRLHIPSRGVRAAALSPAPAVPAAIVEFVTITNPVDEGLVRSYVFMDRAAMAILNGLKNLFWRVKPPA